MSIKLKSSQGMEALVGSQFIDGKFVSDELATSLMNRVLDGYYDNKEPVCTVSHIAIRSSDIRSYRKDGTFSSRSKNGTFSILASNNGIRYLVHRTKDSLLINRLS
jgi:hypothetical protein